MKWFRFLLVVALIVAAMVAARRTIFKPEPVPVTVVETDRGRVQSTVTNSKAGTIRTRRRAELSPELGGRVAVVHVREGDWVETGQPLLSLADDEHRAAVVLRERALEAAVANRRQACFAAELAERELTRHERLGREEVIPEELVDIRRSARDETQAACTAAGAAAREARAALELARVSLRKTVLLAPFAGVVAEVETEIGQWITPSPAGIALPAVIELIDPEAIYLSAPIDEVDVARLRVGLRVRITLDAFPQRELRGKVARVAPYVLDREGQNRTFEIEVELDDREFARTLLPGTSADVEVILEVRDGVLRIPSYALLEGGRVLVLREGWLVEVAVETGLRNWQFAEVTTGLAEGDAVVVSLDRVEVEAGAEAVAEQEVAN